jgi:hypothetical protein
MSAVSLEQPLAS